MLKAPRKARIIGRIGSSWTSDSLGVVGATRDGEFCLPASGVIVASHVEQGRYTPDRRQMD